jgi:hypothetical protein
VVSSETDRVRERRVDHGVVRWVETERGKRYTHHECESRAKSTMHSMMRWFARAVHTRTTWDDADMNAHELERLRWLLGDLAAWLESVQRALDDLEGVDRRAERIKALREVAGRTPEEAALYLEKADALEAAS